MMHRIRKLMTSDVSALVAAGIVAQTVNVIAYPVLTHFYTPADFGLFSTVTAISGFAGAVMLLRIDTLYQIASQDEEDGLLTAAIIVALAATALVFVVGLLFGQMLMQKAQIDFHGADWHWGYAAMIALLALVNGIFLLSREFGAKNGRYSRLALAQIARTALTVGSQLGLILALKDAGSIGLMAGFSLGLMAATFMIWPIRAELVRALVAAPQQAFATTGRVLHRFRSYIQVDVVNVLIRMSTLVAYPIFVLMSFGVEETGLYAVASRVTFIPIDVLAAAISTVYFQRLARAVREDSGTMRLYLTTLSGALAIALAIAGLLALMAGPWLIWSSAQDGPVQVSSSCIYCQRFCHGS
ncbi:lipopolysaccharide biosynthesis protein [Rhizorhabdus histidinilytica]